MGADPVLDDVYADDLAPGYVMALGAHRVTEAELVDFASVWDPQYFHIDPERAKDSPFGGLIASGLHTLSICQRLVVLAQADQWRIIVGAGMDKVEFRRPVRSGDVLTGHTTVTEVALEPERQRGLVTYASDLANQHGKSVLGVTVAAYLELRPS